MMRVLVFLMVLVAGPAMAAQASAVFAGGCFWCTEADFEKLDGVSEAISGYAGGEEVDPTYQQVFQAGWAGTIRTIEDLSGTWAVDPEYHHKIVRVAREIFGAG